MKYNFRKLFGKEGIICTLTILWVLLISLVDQISGITEWENMAFGGSNKEYMKKGEQK